MYIRTKDGVYELVDTYYMCVDGVETYMYNDRGRGVEIRGSQILNQSENLEELCDEFVGLVKSKSSDFIIMKVIAHSLKELKDSLKTELNGKTYQSKFDIIYGAIWTDKGLIYVAKMNENGELELI